jgi:hypothetical protein
MQRGRWVRHICFDDALDRITLGAPGAMLMGADERRTVVYHEAGHTLMACLPERDHRGGSPRERRCRASALPLQAGGPSGNRFCSICRSRSAEMTSQDSTLDVVGTVAHAESPILSYGRLPYFVTADALPAEVHQVRVEQDSTWLTPR